MKVGQKIHLSIRRFPEQTYTIIYIGPYSVKLENEEGEIYIMKKSKLRYRLYGPPKESDRTSSSVDTISVLIGGQPGKNKK